VVLFQLGGPDSPQAVEPFLYNLFCDPDIIEIPLGFLLRKPLARWIARRRAPKVAAHYNEIGGRSPILELTERQARALEQALRPHVDARVVMAMRYWHPFTADAIRELQAFQPEQIVLLPLYPQYSFATTGSSLNEWRRVYQPDSTPVRVIERFHDHPGYLDAVVEKINVSLDQFSPGRHPQAAGREKVHLLFSAHGLPESFVKRGDPYQREVEATARLVMARGGWSNAHSLCYQSKVGPQKWLEPSLDDSIHRLAREGVRQLLVIPIAFVSEHIETLHEINMETREEAEALGICLFRMAPAVGDSPRFIAALSDLVLRAAGVAPAAQSGR
jgi:ferrochelatase